MKKYFESKHHNLEKDYWWFRVRRDIIYRLIQSPDINTCSKILDVGCAGGHLIDFLQKHGFKNTSGIDISEVAINLCKKRGIKNVFLIGGEKTGFNDEEFDVIVASDVLEHIENEKSSLNEWNRILKVGGRIIIFAPAFNFLWSVHDDICHHYRRYSKSTLISVLMKANFKIEKTSYWNFSLFFLAGVVRISKRIMNKNKGNRDQFYELNPLINNLLTLLLKYENQLIRILNFPFGVSIFAVAKK